MPAPPFLTQELQSSVEVFAWAFVFMAHVPTRTVYFDSLMVDLNIFTDATVISERGSVHLIATRTFEDKTRG